jgi:hypothetical protein
MSDSSSSLNNIFNDKSVTNIRYFSFVMFLLLCVIISVEFFISLSIINDSNDRIFYADKAFNILNALLYTKFFLTEAVLSQSPNYTNYEDTYAGNNTQYILDMMAEMSNYRQVITDTYSYFSNATVTFDQAYYDFINTQVIYVRTLSNGFPGVIQNPFTDAINRIPTTIFYVSTVNNNYNLINMKNRNAYELMMNLLNDYFLNWRALTLILVDDVKNHTDMDIRLIIIFAVSFLLSAISILGIRLLINKFIDDREKPVDLFLTIKKQKFEELKYSSEAFLNKLMNKFFGNEEAEEEMMFDSSLKIKHDDIVIAKFKQKNEYKQSIRTSSEYLLIILKIFIFFFIFQAYMAFKYVYITMGMQNLNKFADVFNITQYSQCDLILSTNVAKQFYMDRTVPILNSTNTEKIFQQNIINISDKTEEMIKVTYSNVNYLSSSYIQEFKNTLNNDISVLLNTTDPDLYLGTVQYVFLFFIFRASKLWQLDTSNSSGF